MKRTLKISLYKFGFLLTVTVLTAEELEESEFALLSTPPLLAPRVEALETDNVPVALENK